MKTLALLIIACLLLVACNQDYDDINYSKQEYGKVVIDSTKFRPVLMMEKDAKIFIADDGGVKEIEIPNNQGTVGLAFLFVALAFLLGFVFGLSERK